MMKIGNFYFSFICCIIILDIFLLILCGYLMSGLLFSYVINFMSSSKEGSYMLLFLFTMIGLLKWFFHSSGSENSVLQDYSLLCKTLLLTIYNEKHGMSGLQNTGWSNWSALEILKCMNIFFEKNCLISFNYITLYFTGCIFCFAGRFIKHDMLSVFYIVL